MSSPTQQRGYAAERRALRYLKKNGLRLICRQYQCRWGEIDLIMRDQGYLVFIEVRYRQHHDFGTALDTITLAKQHRIIKTAQFYLQQQQLYNQIDCRFDTIGINQQQIEWCQNAF